MWRKNRVPSYGASGCSGTDLNRNFPYHWGEGNIFQYFFISFINQVLLKKKLHTASHVKKIYILSLSLFLSQARASCYQCDTQYRGPFPQSENESQAIVAAIQALNQSIRAYITVHSYSQMWLTRWGYSNDETEDYDEQVK